MQCKIRLKYFFFTNFQFSNLYFIIYSRSNREINLHPSLLKSRFPRALSTREFYKRVIYFAREPVYARTFIQKLHSSGSFLTNYPLKALGGGRGRFHALVRIAVLTPLDRETRFKDITPAVPDHFIRLRTSARIIKNWAIQFVRIENLTENLIY